MIKLKPLLCEWTGETWSSCRQWASQRSKYLGSEEGVYVGIELSTTQFQLTYIGPDTGLSLAHANKGTGDTLHQLFNVLICEINPWLADNKIRPNIADIKTQYYAFCYISVTMMRAGLKGALLQRTNVSMNFTTY
jgi:hypothetical protein